MITNLKKNNLQWAILWSIIEVFIKRALDLVVKLILARLLFPEDFGIIGMATVFTSLVQVINDSGMANFLIQIDKDKINKNHYHTAFWTGIVWAIFLYFIISFILSPLISNFYSEDILNAIIPVLSLSILFSSLNTVNRAQLHRELRFKELAFINNLSSLAAGIFAIALALYGYGVWALVINVIATYLISVPLYFKSTKWFPDFIWKKDEFKQIFGFGFFTTLTDLLNNINSNIDYLVIGKLVSAFSLGSYTLSYMLTILVKSQIESMVNRVMFPVYSKNQTNFKKVKDYYLSTIKYYSIITFPLMLFLIVFGDQFIFFVFGEKWFESILPMKILAIAVVVDLTTSSYGLLFRSVGKPDYEMKITILISFFIQFPAIILGVYFNGIIGVAYGVLFTKILSFVIIKILLYNKFKISFSNLLYNLKPALISLTATFFIIFLIFNILKLQIIVSIILMFVVFYSILSFFLKSEIKIFIKYLNNLIK